MGKSSPDLGTPKNLNNITVEICTNNVPLNAGCVFDKEKHTFTMEECLEHHRLSTCLTERPGHDGMFTPRGRKPNDGLFPRLSLETDFEHSNRLPKPLEHSVHDTRYQATTIV
ncbi:hypothetical protein A2U01_0018916 [Trifolium medium]|uniref:Uncharacterized protein n=1 Tax=Trifolium medium TaxID=97028 RepID=A0A392NFE5_9FABA|nr:hypothetical protein [Trifolium medium]